MSSDSWILASLGTERLNQAREESARTRLNYALGTNLDAGLDAATLRFVADSLELRVHDELSRDDQNGLVVAAADAFQIARAIPRPNDPMASAEWLLRVGCLAILGDRGADMRRDLIDKGIPELQVDSDNWGLRVWACTLDIWLRLFRKHGWDDLEEIQQRVSNLRRSQGDYEPRYLARAEEQGAGHQVWELIVEYHLTKAAEILAIYLTQGSVDGYFDIREQLEAQFDRALDGAVHGQLIEREILVRLLSGTARALVENSVWTVTRSVNSRMSRFVETLLSHERANPIFELLPPQRRALREEGLLGSVHRSIVVSLPTSSGKTFIAQFRILQALNQFESERGWVAYLAPTRALVNQLTVRLRRDFMHLGTVVEKASPALEIDGLETAMLTEKDAEQQFRILVTTPEKLDLMLRSGWEEKIGRPLTLVVVDEAHGLASSSRGLRLELLLATINRECRHSQFLLLTPFIQNAQEIARWLSPDSNKSIELAVDWTPNDRVVATAQPYRGAKRGDFSIRLTTQHTNRNTMVIPDELDLAKNRPLNLRWSDVSNSPGKLAAATAQLLHPRGTVIVLVDKPVNSWGVANTFKIEENRQVYSQEGDDEDIAHIKRFLDDEMGEDYPLNEMLDYGIAVHHAGLSEDTRALVEWLTERSKLRALVATTTIAQGVNFPVSGVVFSSYQYPYGVDMSPEEFWNICGRAGRVDQGDIGIVVVVANNADKSTKATQYLQESVGDLNSTLIAMVQEAMDAGNNLQLERLSWQPEWSAFVQYLSHSYRLIDNHERFAAEVEQVLRGTLGFQALRRSHKGWADQLVRSVYNYAEHIKGKPLELVDLTGFSWESVSTTLARLSESKISEDVWGADLFSTRRGDLQTLMGILLQVPELRERLASVTGGTQQDGNKLARIVCDWVQGVPLTEMAQEHFASRINPDGQEQSLDSVAAMTNCCSSLFGKLTQTASWGLSALQSLTLRDRLQEASLAEQRTIRNLPARIYYGVNSDEAVALRLLGVPRNAATPLSGVLQVNASDTLPTVRSKLRSAQRSQWSAALGPIGESYHRVWSIIEGQA